MIRQLAPLGFKSVGIESGYFEIKEQQRWRANHDNQGDPIESGGVLGINKAIREEYLRRIVVAEEEFFDELEKLGLYRGQQIFGFDVDKEPDFISTLSADKLSDLERQVVRASLSFCEKVSGDSSDEDLVKAFSQREELMETIVLRQLLREDKVILLGHNGHLSKSSREYALVNESESGPMTLHSWRLLGDRLNARGIESLCVFQIANKGSHSAPFREKIPFDVFPEEGTYEAALAKDYSAPVFLPTRTLIDRFGRLDFKENFISRIRGRVERMADWIVYYPDCTGI